ncbi:DeoR family transcriptional regulator [Murinocardiopsis flavida]|uniref:DeoR family transcriptional regulator n=1 Tax=Murinocardiopsis flavida TaxID=645275 RepID=A0A2P8CJ87_9ACTN|nr:DeoR/GlpR family DNA-binding transcription regulator [Murinocardiopsis flavida]PSK85029.1 DeoR family transcriptional regulator [Murinocardiopsis flavida]
MTTSGTDDEAPLIPDQRRELLVRLLRSERVLSVHQLTEALGVSHMTVRRDISALEGEGRVLAIPGGARLPTRVGAEPSRADKSVMEAPQKAAIAREAARLVRDDMVVYLDAGTTTLGIAGRIEGVNGLTVVTNDFAIVEEFGLLGEVETVHIGGQVEYANRSTIGLLAANTLRGLNIDIAFISASSWSAHHGVTTPVPGKVEVKTAAMDSASVAVLVADSSKYGSFSMYRAAELRSFSSVITDSTLSDGAVESVRSLGIELVLADDENEPAQTDRT